MRILKFIVGKQIIKRDPNYHTRKNGAAEVDNGRKHQCPNT